CFHHHRHLHSFPTRRSSDLAYAMTTPIVVLEDLSSSFDAFGRSWELTRGARGKVAGTIVVTWLISQFLPQVVIGSISGALGVARSEEHTSELQSRFDLVCRL